MKIIFNLLVAMCLSLIANAQWAPVGNTTNFTQVNAITEWNGKLYTGTYDSVLRTWDGSTWNAIARLKSSSHTAINAITVYKNDLYIAGVFDNINGVAAKNVARYDGMRWYALDSAFTNMYITPGVYAMTVYNNDLYVGGGFDSVRRGVVSNSVAKWNGTQWLPVPGIPERNFWTFAFTEYNGKLYIGGGLIMMIGMVYTANSSGVIHTDTTDAFVKSLCVFQGKLYMGGNFTQINKQAMKGIGVWNGSSWSSFGTGATIDTSFGGSGNGVVFALSVYKNNLFIGGTFEKLNTTLAYSLARYDGTTVYGMGECRPVFSTVFSFATYGTNFYCGGAFDSIGMTATPVISRFIGTISNVGIHNSSFVQAIVYPIPAVSSVTIVLPEVTAPLTVTVTDVTGREVRSLTVTTPKFVIDRNDLPSGMYIVHTFGRQLFSAKIIFR